MASFSRFQASIAIRRCAEALRDKLIEIEGKHIRNMSPRGQQLLGQLPVIEDCLNSGAFSYKELRELDNDGLQLLLNICINMAKKYHLSSPLASGEPITVISKWIVSNEWTRENINRYNETLEGRIDRYKDAGEKFTCEDLALSSLIDFAYENGLPVTISNGMGEYNSRKWEDVEEFKKKVLTRTGAHDLMKEKNTVGIDRSQIGPGTLILMDDSLGGGDTDGRIQHIQVVTGKVGERFTIRQGNLPPKPGKGAGNYGTDKYKGVLIQERFYDSNKDIFYGGDGKVYENAVKDFGMYFRRWNFWRM